MIRLREKASECSFGKDQKESFEIALIDKLLQSSPKELQEKMLQNSDLTLEKAIQMASSFYTVRQQVNELGKSGPNKEVFVNRMQDVKKSSRCLNCNLRIHDDPRNCPVRNEKCHNCGKTGHYARCCRAKKRKLFNQKNDRIEGQQEKRQRTEIKFEPINNVNEDIVNVSYLGNEEIGNVVLKVGGIPLKLLIDSGTNLNLIDDRSYQVMISAGLKCKQLGNDRLLFDLI